MPVSFTCPHCGKQTNVDDRYIGQSGPCSGCGQTITIATSGLTPVPGARTSKTGGSGGTIAAVAFGCLAMLLVAGGLLVALLYPAMQSARARARRAECPNNLKQIGLALHNYHDTYGSLPPAYLPDKDGKPVHSWRVLILPFLGEQALYDQYNFDQPWDSPANQAVINQVPRVFQCPMAGLAPNSTETNYLIIAGPGTLFDGAKATKFQEVTDGTANTIMAVEVVNAGVSWAEPVDLDASRLSFPLSTGGPGRTGSRHPGGIHALFGDGSVRFLSDTTLPATVQALTTKAGGEVVPADY
jgi:prepilin-type processing-associated H-X9-DG protein